MAFITKELPYVFDWKQCFSTWVATFGRVLNYFWRSRK